MKTFEALNLPPKFLLAGHSFGGWLASIYASFRPERVESLFLISPAGTEAYNENTYDLYSMRDPEDITKEAISKKKADYLLDLMDRKGHPYEIPDKIPYCIFKRELIKKSKTRLRK